MRVSVCFAARRFPTRMLHDETVFRPVLQKLELGSRAYFGVDGAKITPLRSEVRPSSNVLRASVRTSAGEAHIYVKVGRVMPGGSRLESLQARLQRDFDTTLRVHLAMQHDPDTSTVRPIACFPEHLALVTEEAVGENFLELLERNATRWRPGAEARLTPLFERVGRWVQRFQEVEGAGGRILLHDVREYIDIRMRRFADDRHSPFTSTDRGRVLRYLEQRSADIDEEDSIEVAVHADYGPGNVIHSGDRVVVLDFHMHHRGPRFLDAARFHTQLEALKIKPQFDPAVIGHLQAALLRGYRPDLTATRPLFEVMVMLHTVNHFGTLVTKPAPFPVSLYNRFLARRHLRWIRATVDQVGSGTTLR